MINRILIKARAKATIFSTKPSPLFAGLMLVGVYFLLYVFQYTVDINKYLELFNNGSLSNVQLFEEIAKELLADKTRVAIQLCLSLLNSYISFGMICYSFRLAEANGTAELQEMFPPVLKFLKAFVITLITAVIVAVGSAFFIIPGLLFGAYYSQAKYVMIDNPEFSVIRCLSESRRLMKGHVIEYYVFQLSFFGWAMLTSMSVITGIWTYPYMNVSMVLYYKNLLPYKTGV